jgi:DME family drug/metabolite transporter
MESSPVRHRLMLAGAALLFSTGGAAIKAASFTSWQIASFRSAVAAVFLLAALPEARRGWRWKMAPVTVAYAATLILFVLSTRLTTAANAIFLQDTAPLYVLLIGPWLLRERVRRADLLYMMAMAIGMSLFFLGAERAAATAPNPALGNRIALASGISWALTLTGLRWLGRDSGHNSAMATVAAGNLIGALVALPMALPVSSVTSASLAVILYLGIVQIGVAYVLVTRAIRHVPAFEATTVLLLEPALNPLWTWLVHGEKPAPWSLAGGAIILLATLVNTWRISGTGYATPQ